jgi:hypothetical protein
MRAMRITANLLAVGLLTTVLSMMCGTTWAQAGGQGSSSPAQPGKQPGATPPPEDLEPGVNTSATPSSSAEPAPSAAAVPAAKRADAAAKVSPAAHPGSKVSPASVTPVSATTVPPAATVATAPRTGAGAGKSHDSIELDSTQITGNRELPKVLYIVPWKRSDLGDLVGKPVNSLLDEVLAPVDRDVFKRENRYYDALKPDAPKDAAAPDEKH